MVLGRLNAMNYPSMVPIIDKRAAPGCSVIYLFIYVLFRNIRHVLGSGTLQSCLFLKLLKDI